MNSKEESQNGAWEKKKLAAALKEAMASGLVPDLVLEGAVVWRLRHVLLIAQLRKAVGAREPLYWLIAGEYSATDVVPFKVATSAKEAAKHFALKWQLGVAQLLAQPDRQVNGQWIHKKARELEQQAEGLYELAENQALWHDPGSKDP